MTFQEDLHIIRWKLHLKSSPEVVYQILSTEEGRANFWPNQRWNRIKQSILYSPIKQNGKEEFWKKNSRTSMWLNIMEAVSQLSS